MSINNPRGTSNSNCSGSAAGRRARKNWMLETFKADVSVVRVETYWGIEFWCPRPENLDIAVATRRRAMSVHPDLYFSIEVLPTCRCYRCGEPLTFDTLTVDRIVPGDKGGTYRRNNIRPACGSCNSITGNEYRWSKPGARKKVKV